MQTKRFDQATVKKTMEAIREDLKALSAKHGLDIKTTGSVSFSDSNFRFTVEVSMVDESGEVLNREAADFKQMAHLVGLDPQILHKTFIHKGDVYKIAGLLPRSTKQILCIRLKDGVAFKFPKEAIARLQETILQQ